MSRLLVTSALASLLVACGPIGSEVVSVPDGLRAFVDGGRASLEQNQDGLLRSTFTFHEARCRQDGGIVLIFDQRGLLGSQGFAFALSGQPQSDPGAWGGGFAPIDPEKEDEIAFFFAAGGGEVPCAT